MTTNRDEETVGRVDVVFARTFELKAPLRQVFAAVHDFRAWQGYDDVEHVSGPAEGEGRLVVIGKSSDAELVPQAKFCKTIRLDPHRQIIWRVYTGPGQVGADGWEHEWGATIDYTFEEVGPDTTSVRLQVIKEYLVPDADDEELARVQASEARLQVAVVDANHPRLLAVLGL